MIKSLSKSQIEQYHEEGYTVVEGALSADRLAETLRLTDEIIDAARGLTDDDDRFKMVADAFKIFFLCGTERHNGPFDDLMSVKTLV